MRPMTILGTMAAIWVGWGGVSLAGQLNAPAEPTNTLSAMYTLNDIYNRLSTGATTNPLAFTEPVAGPTNGTMRTLNDVYSTAIPTRVPRTGQTPTLPNYSTPATSDGKLQKGFPWPNPRFSPVAVSGPQTNQIMDNVTGLIWARDANIASNTGWSLTGQMAWTDAFDVVTNPAGPVNGAAGVNGPNGYGGTNDWRLPNVGELYSLLALQYDTPCLSDWSGTNHWTPGNPFVSVISVFNNPGYFYWTSSTSINSGGNPAAFGVCPYSGKVNALKKSVASYWVWPVRGGR